MTATVGKFGTPHPRTKGIYLSRIPDNGIAVLTVHFSARPDMTPERVQAEKNRYPNEALWQREMEIDPHALSGQKIYPEFNPEIHVVPDRWIPNELCRYMALDPHPRTPHYALWIGVDCYADMYVYRELWPSRAYGTKSLRDSDEDNLYPIRDYVDAIARLEGNSIEWRHAETEKEYGIYRHKRGGEKIIARLMDQAGKGFAAADEAQAPESFSARYAKFGLQFRDPIKSHGAGEDAIHDALQPRENNLFDRPWPRLHIAASCLELAYEFIHLRYESTKSMTQERELKQQAVKARCHGIDLVRYLLASNVCHWIPNLAS